MFLCAFLCQINMNIDVRLIQVNERMVKHKLLVAVADWVQSCTGNMQVVLIKSIETVRISGSICARSALTSSYDVSMSTLDTQLS